jgi:hypothetical protein
LTEIERVQAEVDAKIDAIAGAGRSLAEGTAARLHHQPTPSSIAQAEGNVGEGATAERAIQALDRARTADHVGDAKACKDALAEARAAINP